MILGPLGGAFAGGMLAIAAMLIREQFVRRGETRTLATRSYWRMTNQYRQVSSLVTDLRSQISVTIAVAISRTGRDWPGWEFPDELYDGRLLSEMPPQEAIRISEYFSSTTLFLRQINQLADFEGRSIPIAEIMRSAVLNAAETLAQDIEGIRMPLAALTGHTSLPFPEIIRPGDRQPLGVA